MKNLLKKARKGFSLVELLIAVVVLGILGAMLIAAGTAAQNKARVSVASNDIDSVRNAVYTAFMMKPQVMQYTDGTANWAQTVVNNINEELDENWQWELLPEVKNAANGAPSSGPIAQTPRMRDPWNNPYTMYIYTDSFTTTYRDETGTQNLPESDSVMYVVIASAGPNGTGVGMGYQGNIAVDATSGIAVDGSRANMVNNTDGIDDLGVVIRIRNGSTSMATFGWGAAAMGDMANTQWVFCGHQGAGSYTVTGKYTKKDGSSLTESNPFTSGSSLDQFSNLEKLQNGNALGTVVGN